MLHPFTFEETYRLEQEILDAKNMRRAIWHEREPRRDRPRLLSGLRRRLAQTLLLLADRLDPRTVVHQMPHAPSAPSLNGTLHHA